MLIKQVLSEIEKKKKTEYIYDISSRKVPCSFNGGISEEDLYYFAQEAISNYTKREVEIKVNGPIVTGVVRSQSGQTVWLFSVDFNDYGRITGKFWIYSENSDSSIPYHVATNIEKQILTKLGVLPSA